MTYEQHSLRAALLEDWARALMGAVRIHLVCALCWLLFTLDLWEGAIALLPALLAFCIEQELRLRARRHVRQMRAHLDRLCVRR